MTDQASLCVRLLLLRLMRPPARPWHAAPGALRSHDPGGGAHEEAGAAAARGGARGERAAAAARRLASDLARKSHIEAEDADLFRRHDAGKGRVVRWTPGVLRAALHNALAVEASVADVQTCLQAGASLEWRDEDSSACGMGPMHLAVCSAAASAQRLAMIGFLLSQGVSVDTPDLAESTPLHCAAAVGEPEAARMLLRAGALPSERDAEFLTPLHVAANNGHAEVVRLLAGSWAQVDAVDHTLDADEDLEARLRLSGATEEEIEQQRRLGFGRAVPAGASLYVARRGTPLHVAAAADRAGVALALLLAGADANHRGGPHGTTPLHIACRCGHAEVAELLAANGADVDARDDSGDTPLMRAVEGRHAEIARWLLALGADARATTAAGLTALHVAAAVGAHESFRDLVEAGADVHARTPACRADGDGGRAPVHYAAHYGGHDAVEAFDTLLALGADPLMRSLAGYSSAGAGAAAAAAAAAAADADADADGQVAPWDHESAGWPPLFYAIESKTIPLVAKLCAIHADAHGDTCPAVRGGRTPHVLAAIHDAPKTLAALVAAWPGAERRADSRGRTAMHYAATFGSRRAYRALLEMGMDDSDRDATGVSPAEILARKAPPMPRPARDWEEERRGAAGEARWDYAAVMEHTSLRYVKKTMAARRVREIARERQCSWKGCGKFLFDAKRCKVCKAAFYCNATCQRHDWEEGGHSLVCKRPHWDKDMHEKGCTAYDEYKATPY